MLLYTTVGTNDIQRAIAFWAPIMASLGHDPLPGSDETWAGWGKEYDDGPGFYVVTPFDDKPATAANGSMYAFPARSAAHVRDLYGLALRNGGTGEGAPGTRENYEPDFYVAYARDPDGHKLAFVFHHYNPESDQT